MVASLAMKTATIWDNSATTAADDYKIVWAHHARCFAKQQMDYIMGSTGHSFVTGFGVRPPTRPHHRGASCAFVQNGTKCQSDDFPSATATYPNTLVGGLVGGPDGADQWADSPLNPAKSEVALDFNAALVMGAQPARRRPVLVDMQCVHGTHVHRAAQRMPLLYVSRMVGYAVLSSDVTEPPGVQALRT
jgi:Glycosyl hydrolase family 9